MDFKAALPVIKTNHESGTQRLSDELASHSPE